MRYYSKNEYFDEYEIQSGSNYMQIDCSHRSDPKDGSLELNVVNINGIQNIDWWQYLTYLSLIITFIDLFGRKLLTS